MNMKGNHSLQRGTISQFVCDSRESRFTAAQGQFNFAQYQPCMRLILQYAMEIDDSV